MLDETIRNFPSQFTFEPHIENERSLKAGSKFLVCGMGGSQLQADILRDASPQFDVLGWRDYGLPVLPDTEDRLIILSSYSGNTEEVIESLKEAHERGLHAAVLSKGGKLTELAREYRLPYVLIPDTGIQPRHALGFMIRGLMALIGDSEGLHVTRGLADLKADQDEALGKALAKKLKGRVPVIYASHRNESLARNWKIKFNENSKVPAFWNVFSELNHNEMNGFDVVDTTRPLTRGFHFVFIEDEEDHPHNRKRMQVLKDLYEKRGLAVEVIRMQGTSRYERLFSNLLFADWTTYHTAVAYGTEPEQVPMVEEFKKLI